MRRLTRWFRDHDLLHAIYVPPAIIAIAQWAGLFHV